MVQSSPALKATVPTPAEAGREFLAAHPEAQKLIDAAGQGFYAENSGAFLQAVGLTPAERNQIALDVSKYMSWTLGVGGLQFEVGRDEGVGADLKRLRQLLGDSRFQQFEELRRLRDARSLAQTVAGATYDSDAPLTREQADAMVQSMKRHNLVVSDKPVALNLNTIDWPAVTAELASVLSPSQLAVFEAARLSTTLGRTAPAPTQKPAETPKP